MNACIRNHLKERAPFEPGKRLLDGEPRVSIPAFFWLNEQHGLHKLLRTSDVLIGSELHAAAFLLPSGIGTTRDKMDTSAETLKEI